MHKYHIFYLLFSFCLYAQDDLIFQDLFNDQDPNISCYRIPSLATAPNGNLLAVIDERVESCGDLRHNRNINIVMKSSSDNGNTWSNVKRIIDYPLGQSASDPSIIGKPYFFAIFLASILSPILEIISALGPMNLMPCLLTISENFAFSERKP